MNQRHNHIVVMMCAICMIFSCDSSSDTAQDGGSNTTQGSNTTVEEYVVGFSANLADATAGAYSSRVTRNVGDGELTTDLLHDTGFGVFCWYTEGNNFSTPTSAKYLLMRNQRVEYDEALTNPWHYSPSKYWPLDPDHKLTFRAYAPYVSYNLIEEVVADPNGTYVTGMPLLPVVVGADDYQRGVQHDPLWGTGRLVQDIVDPTPGATPKGEYFPEPDPADPDQSKSKRYGTPYNDMTYQMSGDKRLTSDSRDGFIDWYFHHGMAKIVFTCSIIPDPGCDKVTIKRIIVEPLYKQGLLDIGSPTEDESEKPWWYDRDVDMTVDIGTDYLASTPLEIPITDPAVVSGPVTLLSEGLLIIPRDYGTASPMTIKVYYTIDDDDDVLEATGAIPTAPATTMQFKGNTVYTVGLSLTPETRGIEIDIVQSAFTAWREGGEGPHVVYNW